MSSGSSISSEKFRRPAFDFRTTEKIVKPRKPYGESRPLIVCTNEIVWSETDDGEIHPRSALADILITHPSSIFVCENAPAILIELSETFAKIDGWQWRVTPVERRKLRNHLRSDPTVTRDVTVNYFGFRFPNKAGTRFKTYYHYPLDVFTFLGGSIGKTFPDVDNQLRALIQWGTDVRQFCIENNLKVSPTTGGIAAQLLRDPRFIDSPRRKVPRATNERARPQLPGNHYELFIPENTNVKRALYLDMTGAHHFAASRITFPHPDRLYARGQYRTPPTPPENHPPIQPWAPPRRPWAPAGTRICNSLLKTHGLFLLRVNVPGHLYKTTKFFPPPWLRRKSGSHIVYVYSNELPMIAEFGAVLEGVEAAWTASIVDDSLNRYADWSRAETAQMTTFRRAWAKSTLLSAYGMLAARPRRREFGYPDAAKGEPNVYMTSGGPLPVMALRTQHEMDSPIANVIARGMIEAEVRKEVLTLAGDLHTRGSQIIALYADSIVIGGNAPLPLLPEQWRVKSELHWLTFFNAVSFASDEMVRLPGVPDRDTRERLERLGKWREKFSAFRR